MTTSDQLKEIRDACIAANPDIHLRYLLSNPNEERLCILSKAGLAAGLTPGRKFEEPGYIIGESRDRSCWRVSWTRKGAGEGPDSVPSNYAKEYIQELEERKITLTLADVLLAIRATQWSIAVRDDGRLLVGNKMLPAMNTDTKEWCDWNLRQDRLEDQSAECIDFLYSLIKKV